LDLLFPPSCAACGTVHEGGGAFCERCEVGLEPLIPGCSRCAEPGEFRDDVCPRCQLRPPPFSRVWVPFHHDGPVARAIHRFKYEDHPELARPLAALLAQSGHPERRPGGPQSKGHPERGRQAPESKGPPEPFDSAQGERETWSVCAIPLHASRYHQRLYDQAELLASELAKCLGLPFIGALERTRATQRQVGLSEAARVANVDGAFRAVANVTGRRLLLVDDVFTTGSTARAAARALIEAGALEVVVVTVARAASDADPAAGTQS
jgi:predicted amidophosphoribosyltransferase